MSIRIEILAQIRILLLAGIVEGFAVRAIRRIVKPHNNAGWHGMRITLAEREWLATTSVLG